MKNNQVCYWKGIIIMKSNFFKYIFIIFAIGIMIFAIVKIKSNEKKENEESPNIVEETEETIKEIKLGVASFDSINPILSKNKNIQDISKIIFEPLLTITPEYRIDHCLAKEWAKQTDTIYLIKLRDDVRWSDGNKFTAEDVKFTIEKLKSSDTIYKSNIEHIVDIEIVDKTTIKINLDQEVPFFEYNLTFPILSSKYYSDKEFLSHIVPVGTGMYKVTEVQQNALVLSKNEYYWDNKKDLKLEKITINIYSSAGELYNAFKIGNIDFVSTQNSNLQEYIGTIGYIQKEMKGREHDFIALNTQSQILSQVNVRKAISKSIDKSNIVSSIFADKYYTSDFPLDYGNWVYKEQNLNTEYNLDEAKRILLNDGWEYKYRYWQKVVNYKTQRISLNFVVKATNEVRVKVAENIKEQLENQGIRINLIKASDLQYENYLKNKNYDLILCSMNLSISPNLSTFFGQNNLANFYNDDVDNLLNEVKNTVDDNKIKQNYRRLGEIYINEVPYISLYNNKYTVAYNKNLVGTVEANWYYQFYNIHDWYKK